MTAIIGSAFLVGLLGSVHCIGMCGPLAIAIGAGGRNRASGLWLYLVGKGTTYMVLGLAAGVVGSAFGNPALGKTGIAGLAILTGIAMIVLGLIHGWKLWPAARRSPNHPTSTGGARPAGPGQPGRRKGAISILMGAALRSRSRFKPYAAGILTGLLPCGLVYAMVAQAASAGSPLPALLVMAAFGLGTAPALWAVGWSSRFMSNRARALGDKGYPPKPGHATKPKKRRAAYKNVGPGSALPGGCRAKPCQGTGDGIPGPPTGNARRDPPSDSEALPGRLRFHSPGNVPPCVDTQDKLAAGGVILMGALAIWRGLHLVLSSPAVQSCHHGG